MANYILHRLMQLVPLLIILSVFVFVVLRVLPGDPLRTLVGTEIDFIPEAERAVLEEQLGLNDPIVIQYFSWLQGVFTGDWGRSSVSHDPVTTVVRDRATVTLQLASLSWLLAVSLAIPIGVVSALRRNTWPDVFVNVAALTGVAVPNFLLGILLIVIFAVYLGIFPTSGFVSLADDPLQSLRHMALPMVALSTSLMTALVRQTRSAMLEVMNEDYIRTARAKGLSQRTVIVRHGLKNALLPVVTVAGLQVGNLISGTVVIESMFAIPGLGRATVAGIYGQDYALVQIVVLILAVSTVMANLVADLLYVRLDPRIRM